MKRSTTILSKSIWGVCLLLFVIGVIAGPAQCAVHNRRSMPAPASAGADRIGNDPRSHRHDATGRKTSNDEGDDSGADCMASGYMPADADSISASAGASNPGTVLHHRRMLARPASLRHTPGLRMRCIRSLLEHTSPRKSLLDTCPRLRI